MYGLVELDRPRPVAAEDNKTLLYTLEYERVTRRLSNYQPVLPSRDFKSWLYEHHFPVYDDNEVMIYLHSIRPFGKQLVWHGLHNSNSYNRVTLSDPGYPVDVYREEVYDKIIPTHVMQRIERLLTLDSSISLFVSNFLKVKDPDPFLLAARSRTYAVIAAWDEPGFTGVPEL